MIQSVERALALLEDLNSRGRAGASLGEISGRLGLKTPTAHNLLKTLVAAGYVKQDAQSRHYALGMKACMLGRRQFQDETLATLSLPQLQALEAEFRETVLLALYRDGMRHTVACVESQRSLVVRGQIGCDENLYDTATGRVLLSLLPLEPLKRWIAVHGLPGLKWPEATTEKELLEEVRKIRTAKFVFYRRTGGDVNAVAVPVLLADPETYVALGMYYPVTRTPGDGVDRIRAGLAKAARTLERNFGN